MRAIFAATLILALSSVAGAATVPARGSISWPAACQGKFPKDIRFEKHKKPGRVEVVHDGEGGSIDLNADGSFGVDKVAGEPGKNKTLMLAGSTKQGTVTRQGCTGSYTAK